MSLFTGVPGLALVIKRMYVSVAYAVWSGLGTAFIAMVGVSVFGEALTVVEVVAVVLIVVGVVMLNMVSPMHLTNPIHSQGRALGSGNVAAMRNDLSP